jgi:GR25 family glycosyltransferase involved in LPS biosynthesis
MEDKIHVQVINLDRSIERWEAISKWRHNFKDFNRFSAIDARTYDYLNSDKVSLRTKLYIKGNIKRAYHDINSVGAIGCSLSWYSVLKNFYDDINGKEYLLVFEDDLNLDKFNTQVKTYAEEVVEELAKLPNGWDLWLLGLHPKRMGFSIGREYTEWESNTLPTTEPSFTLTNPLSFDVSAEPEYAEVKQFLGTHAILFKRESIPKVLKSFFPIEMHYDAYLSFLAQKGDIRIICKPSFSLEQNGSFEGTIAHEIFTPALLNQGDVWYKILFLLLVIVMIILIVWWLIKTTVQSCIYSVTGCWKPSCCGT